MRFCFLPHGESGNLKAENVLPTYRSFFLALETGMRTPLDNDDDAICFPHCTSPSGGIFLACEQRCLFLLRFCRIVVRAVADNTASPV